MNTNTDIAQFNNLKTNLLAERETIITRLREIDAAVGRPAKAKSASAAPAEAIVQVTEG